MANKEQTEKSIMEYWVSKSNELVQRARYSLSLRESRALDYAVSKIQKADKPDRIYKVDSNEAYKVITNTEHLGGKDPRQAYQIFYGLQYRPVQIYLKAGHRVAFNWFDHVGIDENTGEIEFQFHRFLEPYLFGQTENFTAYWLQNTAKMRSVYGPRLYQVLKSYAKGKKIEKTFTLDELKDAIGASFEAVKNRSGVYEIKPTKSYEMYGKLKQAVIDPAVEDVNTFSDMVVSYEAIKTGRKVTAIKFIVNDNHAEAGARYLDHLDRQRHPERYTTP